MPRAGHEKTPEAEDQKERRGDDKDCIYVVPDCTENAPAVSSDCGHTDPVVRTWARSKYRNTADPDEPPKAKVIAICEDDEETDEPG